MGLIRRNQKQLRNKLGCFFILLSLMSCASAKEIVQTTYSLEYSNTAFDPCTLISSIGSTTFEDYEYSAGKIETTKMSVRCEPYQTTKLGRVEVPIQANGKTLHLVFDVEDHSAPIIDVQETLQVEQDNLYFDLSKEVKLSDNYDDSPFLGMDGNYDITTPGSYPLLLRAKDSSGNTSSKEITVEVQPKEVVVVEKEVVVEVTKDNASSPSTTSPSTSTATPTLPPSSSQSNIRPIERRFMFVDGYDIVSGSSACKMYRDDAMSNYIGRGECNALYDASGLPIGYIAQFYE